MVPVLSVYQAFEKARVAAADNLDDDAVYNKLLAMAQDLAAHVRQGDAIKAAKRQQLEERLDGAIAAAGGQADFDAHVAGSEEWLSIQADMDAACKVGVPNKEIYAIRDRIKEFAPRAAQLANHGRKADRKAESKAKRKALAEKLKPTNWFSKKT